VIPHSNLILLLGKVEATGYNWHDMANLFTRLLHPVDPEVLTALRFKLPQALVVSIHEDPSGQYVAKVQDKDRIAFGKPLVTEGETGQELFEMVNDVVFTILDIPENYREYMTTFSPPENIRQELAIKIPDKYLDKEFGLVKV
jgi:hypothetical protein